MEYKPCSRNNGKGVFHLHLASQRVCIPKESRKRDRPPPPVNHCIRVLQHSLLARKSKRRLGVTLTSRKAWVQHAFSVFQMPDYGSSLWRKQSLVMPNPNQEVHGRYIRTKFISCLWLKYSEIKVPSGNKKIDSFFGKAWFSFTPPFHSAWFTELSFMYVALLCFCYLRNSSSYSDIFDNGRTTLDLRCMIFWSENGYTWIAHCTTEARWESLNSGTLGSPLEPFRSVLRLNYTANPLSEKSRKA